MASFEAREAVMVSNTASFEARGAWEVMWPILRPGGR